MLYNQLDPLICEGLAGADIVRVRKNECWWLKWEWVWGLSLIEDYRQMEPIIFYNKWQGPRVIIDTVGILSNEF